MMLSLYTGLNADPVEQSPLIWCPPGVLYFCFNVHQFYRNGENYKSYIQM